MHSQRTRAGFTLIELMIVVAIIAILAAIAIPAYQNYLVRAQVTEGMNLAAGAKVAIWGYVSETGKFPSDNKDAGLAQASSIQGKYVSSVNVAGGKVTVAFAGNGANSAIQDKLLTLSPFTTAGAINWTCVGHGANAMPGRYLPSVCRQ